MRAQNANGYYGLVAPGGANNVWIRTTVNGIIPYQSGGSGSLGTSSWPFNAVHATTFYGSLSGNADTVDSHHFSTVSALPSSPNSSTVYFIV